MKNIIFESKEQYLEMIQAWKASCNEGLEFRAEHYALYAIIRDKDPAKCFASKEQQSRRKMIDCGRTGNEAYNCAMDRIKKNYKFYNDSTLIAPFQGNFTQFQLELMREELKGEK